MLKVLLALVALSGITGVAHAADEKPFGERSLMSESNIAERVSRTGVVCHKGEECAGAVVANGAEEEAAPAAAASAEPRSGETLFNTFCTACHTAGVMGAPKFGNSEEWSKHLSNHGGDFEKLWKSGYAGINSMPPRGTCSDCTEEEFSGAVKYMLDNSIKK